MRLHKDNLIRTLDDWFRFAPPKRGALQWKDYRSAKELARAWTLNGEPAPPEAFLAVLQSTFGPDVQVVEAVPEAIVSFDELPGEKRNCDLLVFCRSANASIVVGVEAKADEPFGNCTVGEYFNKTKSTGSRVPERIIGLSRALFGCDINVRIRELRYQLLHATAAVLAEAGRRQASAAVVVVHEFRSPSLSSEHLLKNQKDWESFLKIFGAETPSSSQKLHGPFRVHGDRQVPGSIPLFLGKIITELSDQPANEHVSLSID